MYMIYLIKQTYEAPALALEKERHCFFGCSILERQVIVTRWLGAWGEGKRAKQESIRWFLIGFLEVIWEWERVDEGNKRRGEEEGYLDIYIRTLDNRG
jgi:hypothetical protein